MPKSEPSSEAGNAQKRAKLRSELTRGRLMPAKARCFKMTRKNTPVKNNMTNAVETRRATFGPHWGNIGAPLGQHWCNIGASLEQHWGRIGATLGPHWGNIRATLGQHCGHIGATLGHIGATVGQQKRVLRLLGANKNFGGSLRGPSVKIGTRQRENLGVTKFTNYAEMAVVSLEYAS